MYIYIYIYIYTHVYIYIYIYICIYTSALLSQGGYNKPARLFRARAATPERFLARSPHAAMDALYCCAAV